MLVHKLVEEPVLKLNCGSLVHSKSNNLPNMLLKVIALKSSELDRFDSVLHQGKVTCECLTYLPVCVHCLVVKVPISHNFTTLSKHMQVAIDLAC